jgi:hypothetical protein
MAMILLLIFCLCVVEQALPIISRNPFLPPQKNSKKHEQVAFMRWHDLGKEASLVQYKGSTKVLYHEKKPLQLGKAEGLGG